jgi:hypothetical protein
LPVFVSLAPIREAIIARAEEMKIIRIPRAESLPQIPPSANRRIWTARTSVPGRERTTERLSSRTHGRHQAPPGSGFGIRREMTILHMDLNSSNMSDKRRHNELVMAFSACFFL